jgi:hypothetical protein
MTDVAARECGYAQIIFLNSYSLTMRVRAILGLTAGPVFSHYGISIL